MSDNFSELIEGPKQFAKDSIALLNRCTKPDRREFFQISRAVGIGFLIMGFIGFFVKLIHIPINNIIVQVLFHHTSGRFVAINRRVRCAFRRILRLPWRIWGVRPFLSCRVAVPYRGKHGL
ncbi:Sec61p translocation complex subunit [Cladochytrium tenue]|nr:Sec61p translocation complex subunit [Cladochytrium tenue]